MLLTLGLGLSVVDANARQTGSDSPPTLEPGTRVAVLPSVNLSGASAPLDEIGVSIRLRLRSRGVAVLPDEELEAFMARHRVRYTGGLTAELGRLFREELEVGAVLVSSIDLYEKAYPPKVAFSARLVATDERTTILWMDGVSRAGHQSPGILDRGLIRDPVELRERALEELSESFGAFFSLDREKTGRRRVKQPREKGWRSGRLRPRKFHRTPVSPVTVDRPLRVAVLPFANASTRRNVDQIMMLHFAAPLVGVPGVELIEPGVVRQTLLRSRLIMERGGLSFPQAELLRSLLDVDLVFAGNVMDYQDLGGAGGVPEVDFTVRAIDTRSRQVVWTSISYNHGRHGVFFYDLGRFYTAHAMASVMAREVLSRITWERPVKPG